MKEISLFDTHNHYNSKEYHQDWNDLLKNHHANKEYINIVATNLDDAKRALEISKDYDNTYVTIGIHPENNILDVDKAIKQLEQLYLTNSKKIIAIGECGLDYHYENNPSKDNQMKLFEQQIKLASKYKLPLVLHIRDAHDDAIKILAKYKDELSSVIIHCFCDDYKYAKIYSEWNFYISFSGVVTFKKNDQLRQCLNLIPTNQILSETDCPFLSPEPKRGTRNDSNNLIYINNCIANVKGLKSDEMSKILINNAIKALQLNK